VLGPALEELHAPFTYRVTQSLRNLRLQCTTVARALPTATLEAPEQDKTRDVVACLRVQIECGADGKLQHQNVRRAVRSMQGHIERARLADEEH